MLGRRSFPFLGRCLFSGAQGGYPTISTGSASIRMMFSPQPAVGWSPFMPGNEPYYGATDAPLKYTLGRYDFEVGVSSGGEVAPQIDETRMYNNFEDFLCDFILGDFAQKKQREVCVTRRGDDLLGKGLEILIALLRSWCGTILLWIFPSIFFDVGARLRKGGDFNCDVH